MRMNKDRCPRYLQVNYRVSKTIPSTPFYSDPDAPCAAYEKFRQEAGKHGILPKKIDWVIPKGCVRCGASQVTVRRDDYPL